jgi:hypothetical protein
MATIKRVVAAVPTPAKGTAATTPKTKAAPGLVPAKKDATPKVPSKFIADYTDPQGKAHRFHVAEFQDFVFANQEKAKLTDEELVALWKKTFPLAIAYTVAHVGGARRDFNAGRHSKAYMGQTHTVPAYVLDAKGIRIPVSEAPKAAPKAKATKAPAVTAATKAAPAPTVAKATTTKIVKGRVITKAA